MSVDNDPEYDLTEPELTERKALRDQLDEERDDLVSSIEERRKEIRALTATKKKHELRLRDLRREIRTGKAIAVPSNQQVSLGIDTQAVDPFEVRYPMARDFERLHGELAVALQGVLVPSIEKLEHLAKHPSTGIFQGIAHWARTELGWMNRKEHPDMVLPSRMPMPEPLSELRVYLGRSNKPRPRAVKLKGPGPGTPRSIAVTPSKKPAARARGRK